MVTVLVCTGQQTSVFCFSRICRQPACGTQGSDIIVFASLHKYAYCSDLCSNAVSCFFMPLQADAPSSLKIPGQQVDVPSNIQLVLHDEQTLGHEKLFVVRLYGSC